jgi:hypothetical protein
MWIANYPKMLSFDRHLSSGEPRRGVKVVRAETARKDVRAYSKELFRKAEGWAAELEEGGGDVWHTWVGRVVLPLRKGSSSRPVGGAKFSSEYRKRMHMPSSLPPLVSTAGGGEDLGGKPMRSLSMRRDEEEEQGQFKSMTDKRWGDFMEGGFDSFGDGGSISKKLDFDLTESARAVSRLSSSLRS